MIINSFVTLKRLISLSIFKKNIVFRNKKESDLSRDY